jgi:hypothetical protein
MDKPRPSLDAAPKGPESAGPLYYEPLKPFFMQTCWSSSQGLVTRYLGTPRDEQPFVSSGRGLGIIETR